MSEADKWLRRLTSVKSGKRYEALMYIKYKLYLRTMGAEVPSSRELTEDQSKEREEILEKCCKKITKGKYSETESLYDILVHNDYDLAYLPLITNLFSEKQNVRIMAATYISKLGDVRAVEPLISSLTHETSVFSNNEINKFHEKVIEALGKLRDSRATEPLIKAARNNSSVDIYFFDKALAEIADKKAVQYLISRIKDSDDNPFSIGLLGGIKDKNLVHTLLEFFNTRKPLSDSEYRWSSCPFMSTASVLAKSKYKDAIQPLHDYLYEHEIHRGSVDDIVKFLVEVKGNEFIEDLIIISKDQRFGSLTRRVAIKALVSLKANSAIDVLIDLLTDEDNALVTSAIILLGKIGDKKACKVLKELFSIEKIAKLKQSFRTEWNLEC